MKQSVTNIIVWLLMIVPFLVNCSGNTDSKSVHTDTIINPISKDNSIPGSFSPETNLQFDSTEFRIFMDSFPLFKPIENELLSFYQKRNFSFAWFDQQGLIEPASNLFNRLLNITEEGVPDKLPYKNQLINLVEMESNDKQPSPGLDLMLTAQYLDYAKLVWNGISTSASIELEWLLPRKETSYQAMLDSLLSGKDVLKNAPVYRQYFLLKEYLKKYNEIKINGGWDSIKADRKIYKIGDSSASVKELKQRLFLLGDLQENNQTAVFDSSLLTAVKQFEKRFGYKEDGLVTATLITEMNVPIEKRINQIIVNMERCRWVPEQLNTDYLLINIPDYKLYVYENDSLVWNMNVVVGKDQHKTVVFNGDMKYIVFSPYWNIPGSIMKNEVLPAIKRNRNYLASHNMEWNGGSIRQKPGPNNSLGLVKFLFPNSHNIYLHDTPAKSLFNEDKRAFSHGCIRLAEPKRLAQYLLRNDSAWDEKKITAAMNSRKEQYVTLKKTMPVFIAYFTSWVDRQGNLNFRNDIYKRDVRLVDMILDNNKK